MPIDTADTDATRMAVCDECGFDASRWSTDDLQRTLLHTHDLIAYITTGSSLDARFDGPGTDAADPVGAVHDLMHHLHVLAGQRRDLGDFEPMTGTIDSIQTSAGGVPKGAVTEAHIDVGGIAGDQHASRKHHGRPWQALCVFSTEVIDALRAEGHPITAGAIGENLTVSGLDWSRMRGGLTISVGDVSGLTSSPAIPCYKIADRFIDGDENRVSHARHPGWARWYSSVLHGGTIRPGDTITIS